MTRGRKVHRPRVRLTTGGSPEKGKPKRGTKPTKIRKGKRKRARQGNTTLKLATSSATPQVVRPAVGVDRRLHGSTRQFRARCSCGWYSTWFDTMGPVARAQTQHLDTHR